MFVYATEQHRSNNKQQAFNNNNNISSTKTKQNQFLFIQQNILYEMHVASKHNIVVLVS